MRISLTQQLGPNGNATLVGVLKSHKERKDDVDIVREAVEVLRVSMSPPQVNCAC